MNTYLGACVELGPEDVEPEKAAGAKVTYFEGYLLGPAAGQGRDPADRGNRARRGRRSVHDAVGSVLRRPLPAEFLDLMKSGTVISSSPTSTS